MKPEMKAKKKVEALERRRALIDALIEFIRTHPESVDGSELVPLAYRTGLRYDFAIIRPLWHKTKMRVMLRLEKYLENWYEHNPDDYEWMGVSNSRIVHEDVTDVPDEELCEMLDDIHYELIPEDYEDEEEGE